MKFLGLAILTVCVGCAPLMPTTAGVKAQTKPVSQDRSYPYHEATFDSFVEESFKCCRTPEPDQFYQTMDREFKTASGLTVEEWIAKRKSSGTPTMAEARTTAESLHRLIKRSIRKFSLERGFEFSNVVSTGERQCFLQSVLIASILQKCGLDAGVAMIWKNITGQTSNNGHAVCLARLDGTHLIVVDASEPMAFPKHQGIFTYVKPLKRYAFLLPQYGKDATNSTFEANDGSGFLTASQIDFLDVPFIQSQFDYYRGERAENGILAKAPTKAGLESSRAFFEKAKRECANNPLVLAMLSRTYRKLGMQAEANRTMDEAEPLYEAFGWVPPGLKN